MVSNKKEIDAMILKPTSCKFLVTLLSLKISHTTLFQSLPLLQRNLHFTHLIRSQIFFLRFHFYHPTFASMSSSLHAFPIPPLNLFLFQSLLFRLWVSHLKDDILCTPEFQILGMPLFALIVFLLHIRFGPFLQPCTLCQNLNLTKRQLPH